MSVTLEIVGVRYEGWEGIRIERSMDSIAGSFALTLSDKWTDESQLPSINAGDRCSVRIDNDVVITGYVDEFNPSLTESDHQIEITGRDATGDLVDCSVLVNARVSGKLEQIAADLAAPFGISVSTQVDTGAPFSGFAVEQGETVFETISRLCKMRAVLPIADRMGNLIITTASSVAAPVALMQGQNIKAIHLERSWKERFSDYFVKGQTKGKKHHPATISTQAKGEASDPEIQRYRPLLIVAETTADTSNCQDRAQWEEQTRIGKGEKVTVTVTGWRQGDAGPLWDLNQLVHVSAPAVRVFEDLLVSGVTYTLSEGQGTETELVLVKPDAFAIFRQEAGKRIGSLKHFRDVHGSAKTT